VVRCPSPNYLNVVSAIAADNVWAVGSATVRSDDQTLVERGTALHGLSWQAPLLARAQGCAANPHASQPWGVTAAAASDMGWATLPLASQPRQSVTSMRPTPTPTCGFHYADTHSAACVVWTVTADSAPFKPSTVHLHIQ